MLPGNYLYALNLFQRQVEYYHIMYAFTLLYAIYPFTSLAVLRLR